MAIFDTIVKRLQRGRRRNEPQRDTKAYPTLLTLGQTVQGGRRPLWKPTPKNLRYFSNTPIARRAINAVRQPLSMLDWEIGTKDGIDSNSELKRQIEVATRCFANPNDDDNFLTFCQQVTEDILCGAGAVEIGKSGDQNRPVWLWPVDGLTIQIFPAWSNGSNEARYLQTIGYGSGGQDWSQGILLRNDELMYLRPNPSTATPFGHGPLEIAFNSIGNQLATAQFAGKVAGNALPAFMLDLGEVDPNTLQTWRSYWRNEVEGQGQVPIVGSEIMQGGQGKTRGAAAVRLWPEGDKALFLEYQEFLRSEIAAAFDLSNMNLNIERDVNRSTAEVSEDRDWNGAIKPLAMMLKSHFDREIIAGGMGFSQVEFRWKGLDREDEEATSKILTTYFDRSVFTVNEIRDKLGEEPTDTEWGDMTHADIEIAKNAARSAGLIEDTALPSQGGAGAQPKASPGAKPAGQPAAKPKPKTPAKPGKAG